MSAPLTHVGSALLTSAPIVVANLVMPVFEIVARPDALIVISLYPAVLKAAYVILPYEVDPLVSKSDATRLVFDAGFEDIR